MSKFDFMKFTGGVEDEFVVHARKYTKEEAIELLLGEYSWSYEHNELQLKPKIEDIKEAQVRYYVRCPQECGLDTEGAGCYTYCDPNAKGSFPVWVISFGKLKEKPPEEEYAWGRRRLIF